MRSTVSLGAGSGLPEKAEAGAVPAKKGLGLNNDDRLTPGPQQNRAHNEFEPIDEIDQRTLDSTTKNIDLMAQDGVLYDELGA